MSAKSMTATITANEDEDHSLPRLTYVIARLERIIKQRMTQVLAPLGVTVVQYTALSILRRRSDLSNAQLARRTYVSPQGMNQILDQLDAAGWIIREPHATHGRIKTVRLSEQGKKMLTACDQVVQQVEVEMLKNIEATEHQKMNRLLIECVQALQGGFENIEI